MKGESRYRLIWKSKTEWMILDEVSSASSEGEDQVPLVVCVCNNGEDAAYVLEAIKLLDAVKPRAVYI